ncbi:hypothetical protein OIU74_001781 [Salix koriyanagi]|uniref:Uncharacterized protein n=1 Tax=Salix koriyanagi TaxID=2511006 RepID=A0A9Q0X324_9ROSI|nr:hypothetical protein OIU74_001781 [Salix koriyanagi]
MGANCLANIQATEAPLATSGVFERGNDDTKAFTKVWGNQKPCEDHHRVGVPISEINVVLSNVSAMSGTSTLEVLTNTSAGNAKTDAFCGNANVLAQHIENSSDVQNVSLNEDNNGY